MAAPATSVKACRCAAGREWRTSRSPHDSRPAKISLLLAGGGVGLFKCPLCRPFGDHDRHHHRPQTPGHCRPKVGTKCQLVRHTQARVSSRNLFMPMSSFSNGRLHCCRHTLRFAIEWQSSSTPSKCCITTLACPAEPRQPPGRCPQNPQSHRNRSHLVLPFCWAGSPLRVRGDSIEH